ncbi:type II toxin-antitoxin system HicB family antitoxin [Acetobacterium woodii]
MKKLFYPAIFIPEKDGGFSVFFPDFPGCNTGGDTIDHGF